MTVFRDRRATKQVERLDAASGGRLIPTCTLAYERRCSMAKKGKGSGKGKYRSAVSGRYVTKKHGKRSPKTTVKESK